MERVIEVRGIKKAFGDHEVLRGVDFAANKGEVTCIIGSSGSGKSTLLRCINLLETPDEGQILYHGEDILSGAVNMPRYHAKVGMVFQQFNLFGNMDVLNNCVTGQMKVLHRTREQSVENAMKYLEKVGMSSTPSRASSPAGRSSASPSPARWRWTRRSSFSTSRRARLTRRWSARCSPSCRSSRRRG